MINFGKIEKRKYLNTITINISISLCFLTCKVVVYRPFEMLRFFILIGNHHCQKTITIPFNGHTIVFQWLQKSCCLQCFAVIQNAYHLPVMLVFMCLWFLLGFGVFPQIGFPKCSSSLSNVQTYHHHHQQKNHLVEQFYQSTILVLLISSLDNC